MVFRPPYLSRPMAGDVGRFRAVRRVECGFTQRDVGEVLCCSKEAIKRFERADGPLIGDVRASPLCVLYDLWLGFVDLQDLFDRAFEDRRGPVQGGSSP
ncbi:MAG: helix-turn-helix transcriptional regulator [Rhodoferax sp.]|nr:helix-turn-helix transcriptional regulator [Rhodoferax sp.]